jgi:uncharacterized Rossmann fold enzyme
MMFTLKKYKEITNALKLHFERDGEARDILDSLIKNSDFSPVEKLIKGKTVFVFGCGPSLYMDVANLKNMNLLPESVLVAADGAAKALLENGVVPEVCVTDLDGDEKALIEAGKRGCVMVIHAHGDNIPKIRRLVPKLLGKKLGTTQVKPRDKIKNFGGFTDGDRAVHLAVRFKAKRIVLFGMDFEEKIGSYSGKTKKATMKVRKLTVGKKLLEELAGKTRIPILNATRTGADILNTTRIRAEDLESEQ